MILERIRQYYPQLSKSQRKLADYLVTSYHDAAFMTAARLAKTVGVNEATVIRFAQRLGYRGFPGMIKAVQDLVYQDLEPGLYEGVEAMERDPFFRAVAAQAHLLLRVTRHISPEVLVKVRDVLAESSAIVIVGQGPTEPLARYMSTGLVGMGRPASSPGMASLELAAALVSAQEGTALVGISMPAVSDRVARVLERGRRQGAHTVSLSQSTISPSAQAAEFALTLGGAEDEGGSLGGSLAVLVDALLHSLTARAGEDAARHAERLEGAREYVLTGHETR